MARHQAMTLESHFVAQARNNRWSNHRLHAACARLTEHEYFAARRSFFGSIHATLDHILLVDLAYLGRLTQRELVSPERETLYRELDALRAAQVEADEALIGFCERLDGASLSSCVSFKRADGVTYTESIASLLAHLFLHQIHHRGQVHDMLSSTSVPPPQLDEFFLTSDLALRRCELLELGLPVE